jgi:hypothetical protein
MNKRTLAIDQTAASRDVYRPDRGANCNRKIAIDQPLGRLDRGLPAGTAGQTGRDRDAPEEKEERYERVEDALPEAHAVLHLVHACQIK